MSVIQIQMTIIVQTLSGWLLLMLRAVPASPAAQRSSFTKHKRQVPSLPTCGLTSSESPFLQVLQVPQFLPKLQKGKVLSTSTSAVERQAQFCAGQGFPQRSFSTALISCLTYSVLGSGGTGGIGEGLPAGNHEGPCLSWPGITFTFWLWFCSSFVNEAH